MTTPRVFDEVDGTDVRDAIREHVRRSGEPAFAIWPPDRRVSYGPRDHELASEESVRSMAAANGYALHERPMGGRPVVLGPGTLALLWAVPSDVGTVPERYEHVRAGVREGLSAIGIEVLPGTARGTFWPGQYGLFADGKVAGFAQRADRDVAVVGGIVLVEAREEVVSMLETVYDAIGEPFDPDVVGSIAAAGGPSDLPPVKRALETAFRDRTF